MLGRRKLAGRAAAGYVLRIPETGTSPAGAIRADRTGERQRAEDA
jgi:hypothetical protein